MQHDEVIWTDRSTFCRNEYNVTGLCNRQSCPLANSNYATVREIEGKVYLFIKTIERAHTPAKLWEKILLDKNFEKAQQQIATQLEHWPKFLLAKCQLRHEKIVEYLKKMRKIELNPENQPILTVKKGKVVKREAKREAKAKRAALVETQIEKELLTRLQQGVYGDIYNLPQKAFENVLKQTGEAQELNEESEEEIEYVEETENESEEELEYELVDDFEQSEDESLVADLEDLVPKLKPKKPYVEIEYEDEPTHKVTK